LPQTHGDLLSLDGSLAGVERDFKCEEVAEAVRRVAVDSGLADEEENPVLLADVYQTAKPSASWSRRLLPPGIALPEGHRSDA